MVEHGLVIGVDLGTTYTGVSYCDTSRTDNIENRIQIVSNWPAVHAMIGTKEKTPTEITYLGGGMKWGGAIPPNIQRHMWTKLELDTPRTGEAAKIRQELLGSGYGGVAGVKSPVDIIADFLAQVLDHLMKNLNVQYTEKLWKTFSITLVITYPAVWSDSAKAFTLQAFSQAGFNQKKLPMLKRTITATEPEAAALYTIMSMRGTAQDKQLAVGDGFVVCDMGGGTVDLISYKVAGVDPTILEEATIGTGDQCGGSFVERSFLRWLEEKLGEKDFREVAGCSAADISRTSLPARLGKMMQEFTACAKSGFQGSDTEDYELRLPAPLNTILCDTNRSIANGEIMITAKDLKEMFNHSLQRTGELLLSQIKAAAQNGQVKVRFAFLVGGFAESQYMQTELQKLVIDHGVQIIKPLHAWSAIARGAAAKGLEQGGKTPIKGRKCRRHYGTACTEPFQPKKHREQDFYICSFTGKKRANKQMSWMISKGQDLPTAAEVHGTVSLHHKFWPGEPRRASPLLLAADIDEAPHRSYETAVYEVARLRVDLEKVPQRAFRKRHNSKNPYYELHYEVHISVQSGLEFSLWVDGKRYGAVTAEYA
ncbi:hypothetical protein P171DRAFT_507242 [Karstenula rhodostoma CBS 690.94]|uniref:Actin-like ATPase domain-containing protein n=1 Tax=Karstenula rhodostoma CBS 690.94 TaxID=1392251 RepID=A0A9P4UF32_9PLEO|nr:hypothetical protein P171DRAFT_507242 [Karstenula rhodostoma CBS 690.94]